MFQKSVIDRHLKEIDKSVLESKFQTFQSIFADSKKQANIRASKEEQYQEGFIRELFCKVLGYTIKPDANYNIFTEAKNDVKDKSNSKKADGAICEENNEEKIRAVIELKGTNTTDLDKVAFQAFSYKNFHTGCSYVIVSNFERLRFYVDVQSDYVEFNLFDIAKSKSDLFSTAQENFALLYLLLSVESIKSDVPLKMKSETVSEEKEITDKFYRDYSNFKRALFADIVERNSDGNKLALFKMTQKLLDRIIFIRFCSDRGLLPTNSVAGIIADWKQLKKLGYPQPLYSLFKTFFERINHGFVNEDDHSRDIFAYNGGLFKTDDALDALAIGDEVLRENCEKIAQYDFESQISVDILGRIFENSLTEIEEVQAELTSPPNPLSESARGNKENTPNSRSTAARENAKDSPRLLGDGQGARLSKRKKDGVFYTPEYITRYIVENTIGKLCEAKRAAWQISDEDFSVSYGSPMTQKSFDSRLASYREWLLNLKILDPACGSGAFLNAALKQLQKEHELVGRYWAKIHPAELYFENIDNVILENNLFGVDINEESVEIAKLSLWLGTAKKNRKLSALGGNIKCGNSLIDDKNVAGEKAFDWKNEFPEVFCEKPFGASPLLQENGENPFSNGGFDVIIGNPPYVSAPNQMANAEMAKNREAMIQSGKYKTLYQKWDLYIPFIELGLRHLLKDGGLCSMIVPYPLTNQLYAEKCRRMLLDEYSLKEIVDCSETKIFADAVVQSCIFIARKARDDEKVKVCTIDGTKVNPLVEKTREELLQDEKTFVWNTKNEERRANRHKGMHVLGDFCYISKGMVLNSDENAKDEKFVKADLISDTQDDIHCKKYIEGKDLDRYEVKRVRYLEYGTERSPAKLSRPTFEELYTHNKLLINALGELKVSIDLGTQYYCEQQVRIALLWKDLHGVENSSISTSIKKFSTMKREEMEALSETVDLRYLLAVMNSTYARVLLANIRGGDYHIVPEHIRNIPIPAVSLDEQKPFVEWAEKMLNLNADVQKKTEKFLTVLKAEFALKKISTKLQSFYALSAEEFVKELKGITPKQKMEWISVFSEYKADIAALTEQIEATDKAINAAVYALYGLSAEEIAAAEG